VVAIAGIGCRIECTDGRFGDLLRRRYEGFQSTRPDLSLRVEIAPGASGQTAIDAAGPFARIGVVHRTVTIEGAVFTGSYDGRSGRGWILQPPDPAPLETFLTAIYANHLLRVGGFLLHAAAIVGPDGARVFFGPSGSGKTTVAGLVGAGVISDEIVAIRCQAGHYTVSGVPWRGTRLSARAAALFGLRQAQATSFTRVAPSVAIRRLLGSVFFAGPDPDEARRFFEVGGDLVQAVPAYEMRFARDRSFWDAVPRSGRGEAHGDPL
jgi:hypothetical protein